MLSNADYGDTILNYPKAGRDHYVLGELLIGAFNRLPF
jgi:hypothetical protein